MFPLKDNSEIGAYFACLVEKDNRYPSMRQFGKAYLEQTNQQTDKTSLDKMSNRLMQIKKGNKSIQLFDLPVFCSLLDVTCEELLSAGEYRVPSAAFMTNRQFAASHDPAVWEGFLAREDKAFLNPDEFGKYALEYALDFENYPLLTYMMEKGHIRFVGSDPNNYFDGFGLETDIERRPCGSFDAMIYSFTSALEGSDRLRHQMILLAMRHGDISTLEKLKAREIPTFYHIAVNFSCDAKPENYRDEELIRMIAEADDSIIDYFSEDFTVECQGFGTNINDFIFPFIGEAAGLLAEKKHPLAEKVLNRCLSHNQKFGGKLREVMAVIMKNQDCTKEQICYYLQLFHKDDIFTFYGRHGEGRGTTNLIRIDSDCADVTLSRLIKAVNASRDTIAAEFRD